MTRRERVREPMSSPPAPDYVRDKAAEGWHLVAVEWEREVEGEPGDAGLLKEEIPYGLRVASDCRHLEESPTEKQAMTVILGLIVEDKPLSQIAAGLNEQDFRTRRGTEWTQRDIFYLMPRMIEVAPQIFASAAWKEQRSEVTARLHRMIR